VSESLSVALDPARRQPRPVSRWTEPRCLEQADHSASLAPSTARAARASARRCRAAHRRRPGHQMPEVEVTHAAASGSPKTGPRPLPSSTRRSGMARSRARASAGDRVASPRVAALLVPPAGSCPPAGARCRGGGRRGTAARRESRATGPAAGRPALAPARRRRGRDLGTAPRLVAGDLLLEDRRQRDSQTSPVRPSRIPADRRWRSRTTRSTATRAEDRRRPPAAPARRSRPTRPRPQARTRTPSGTRSRRRRQGRRASRARATPTAAPGASWDRRGLRAGRREDGPQVVRRVDQDQALSAAGELVAH
jgi:hypothetical protein